MNRPIDAPSSQHLFIGSIYDGIPLPTRNITGQKFDCDSRFQNPKHALISSLIPEGEWTIIGIL